MQVLLRPTRCWVCARAWESVGERALNTAHPLRVVVSDEAMFNATLALNPSVLVFYVHSLCTACPKVLEVAEQLARRRIGTPLRATMPRMMLVAHACPQGRWR